LGGRGVIDFEVKKVSDLNDKVLPLFLKSPLWGSKKENFEDFVFPKKNSVPG
jgi:hypothetical protein